MVRAAVLADVPEIQRIGALADTRDRDAGHPEPAACRPGVDMVYAHCDLACEIPDRAAPLLVDARWSAILMQCEDVVDCWRIAGGQLRFERLRTVANPAREVPGLIDATIDADA